MNFRLFIVQNFKKQLLTNLKFNLEQKADFMNNKKGKPK
jgi:hypothetical protein